MKANVRMEIPQKLGFLVCFVIAVDPLVSRTLINTKTFSKYFFKCTNNSRSSYHLFNT